MTKAEAIQRINEGLGFRSISDAVITRRLIEAQRELERGKTLPQFLIQEDAEITLIQGAREIPLPDDFIREYDDGQTWTMRFMSDAAIPIRKVDLNSLLILRPPTDPGPPQYYVIRSQSLYFGRFADLTYTIAYSYYGHARTLLTNDTNAWTDDPSGYDWLVGVAGYRLASDLRDAGAAKLFAEMRAEGRAALLGEIVAQDDVPQYVGSGL